MANTNLQLIVAVAIVCIALPLKASSMPGRTTSNSNADDGLQTPSLYSSSNRYGHYDNRWLPLGEASTSMLHRPLHRYALQQHDGARAAGSERRSYSGSGSGHGTLLNGLTNLSGMGHISNGYASVAPTHNAEALSKQEIPIYEEQHENDAAAVAAVAATATNDYNDAEVGLGPSGYGGEEHQQQQQQYYNFAGTGEHSSSSSVPDSYLPTFDQSQQYKEAVAQHYQQEQQAGNHYAYDKISVGNYLHSGYEALQQQQQQHHADEQHHQQHQQQQQQQEHLEHASYFTPSHEGASGGDYEQHSDGDEHGSNYLGEAGGHDDSHQQSHQQSHHHHVDIINYVPVKHVKKQHVPVEKQVKIPISHAVIIPIKKPIPIHIPITKNVQVAVEKELKVPVERLVPYPVEKHIPVPVEKRVPYTVIKYLPIKVPKPYPVKVPVFKTVLHKVKSWW